MIDQSDQSASAVVTTIHWSNLSCAPVPTDQHIILSYTHQAAVTHNYDLLSTVDTSPAQSSTHQIFISAKNEESFFRAANVFFDFCALYSNRTSESSRAEKI